MAQITLYKVWTPGEVVAANDLNTNFTRPYQQINGNLDNSNIATAADIEESKLKFSTATGHDHDGINSKLISKGLLWGFLGPLFVSSTFTYAPSIVLNETKTAKKCIAYVNTPSAGNSIIVDVQRSIDNGATWTSLWHANTGNRPTLAAGTRVTSVTNFDITALPADTVLRMMVLQVGSSTAGSDLTVELF
jgi:hypothetical protein